MAEETLTIWGRESAVLPSEAADAAVPWEARIRSRWTG